MKNEYDIKETEIRVLGKAKPELKKGCRIRKWMVVTAAAIIVCLLLLLFFFYRPGGVKSLSEHSNAELQVGGQQTASTASESVRLPGNESHESGWQGGTEANDTIINDVPMVVYTPHYTKVVLQMGTPDIKDSTIVYIAQAADVRADNQHIVGAFVLEGTPLSWGVSKEGYCAIINQKIHIGVSDNTALFEEATAKEGYFFRQYPLVSNGIVCENKPKGKALRRAICQQGSQIFMVHSVNRESFHDFAQALVDLGCTQAIYLVGSDSYGWCVNPKGERLTWGNRNRLNASTPSTSYIVFRK
ncbi:MAG: hypothetical protein KHX53_10605 [Bacteroides sp.]|nr:hypothetical protein [Bacteroides sp.]